jgi:single-stranded-DNA-specific exonuclease
MLEPFGEENPVPLLYTNGLRILSFSFVGKNKEHLKITFAGKDNQPVSAVYWGKARWFAENCHVDKSFSVLYRLEINSFRGSVTVQMNIENMEEEV